MTCVVNRVDNATRRTNPIAKTIDPSHKATGTRRRGLSSAFIESARPSADQAHPPAVCVPERPPGFLKGADLLGTVDHRPAPAARPASAFPALDAAHADHHVLPVPRPEDLLTHMTTSSSTVPESSWSHSFRVGMSSRRTMAQPWRRSRTSTADRERRSARRRSRRRARGACRRSPYRRSRMTRTLWAWAKVPLRRS